MLWSVLKAVSRSSESDSKIAGMAAAVLLKGRNKHLCLPQGVIATIMYAGHSSKMVSLLLLAMHIIATLYY